MSHGYAKWLSGNYVVSKTRQTTGNGRQVSGNNWGLMCLRFMTYDSNINNVMVYAQ